MLDAGCGTGLLLEYMAATGLLGGVSLYACVDYSPSMLARAAYRARVLCRGVDCLLVEGNVMSLPFHDSMFDVVYSFTVLDLVDDTLRAVEELLRVSRGPVVVSMLKTLPYKDLLIERGAPIIGVSTKDVIFRLEA